MAPFNCPLVPAVFALLILEFGRASVADRTADVTYWRSALTADPHNVTLAACMGLVLLRTREVDEGMRLLEMAVAADPTDWVSLEYMGGAYGTLARKLSSSITARDSPNLSPLGDPLDSSRSDMRAMDARPAMSSSERKVLESAVSYLRRGVRMRELSASKASQMPSGFSRAELDLSAPSPRWYPQAIFAQPPTLALRGLGDALAWLGRSEDARAVFEIGVRTGLWSSAWCRPARQHALRVPPATHFFFDVTPFAYLIEPLRAGWSAVRDELAAAVQRSGSGPEDGRSTYAANQQGWVHASGGLHTGGSWHQLPLLVDGKLLYETCQRYWPRTCALLSSLPALRVRDGQTKLSVLQPGTYVRPHCGPSHERLRMHCTLQLPPEQYPGELSWFRVGSVRRGWPDPGHCLVFDESCEHEVFVSPLATVPRIVLILDFANPFLPRDEYEASLVIPPADADALLLVRAQYDAFWRIWPRQGDHEEL